MKYQHEIELEERKAEYKDYLRWKKIVAAKMGWTASDGRLDRALINSHRANQMTVIAGFQINMHVVKVPYRMGVQDNSWDKNAVHYQVRIWLEGNEKNSYVFSYSQGSGIKQFPTIREILFSFVQDAMFGAESFLNFCGNVGGDIDSIKTRKSYEQCVEVFEWFTRGNIYEYTVNQIAGILQEAENMGNINNEMLINEVTKPLEYEGDEIPF